MKTAIGYSAVYLICGITIVLWLFSKPDILLIFETPYRSLSQITSLLAVVLMSVSFILATKLKFLEEIFGGLDKNYLLHHYTGIISFIFILNHPLFLVAQVLPGFQTAKMYLFLGDSFPLNLGIMSFYTIFFSFIFMLLIKVSYQFWLLTHDLLVVAFIFAAVHILTISSDVSESLYLRTWMIFFLAIGILAALYKLFLYQKLGPQFLYQIISVDTKGKVINIILKPLNKKILFEPGQFIYMKCLSVSVPPEMHPFTPSTTGKEDLLRISAKMLGDFTSKMKLLKPGEKAVIFGPHGKFAAEYNKSPRYFLWIAGGIGITPFISLLHAESLKNSGHRIILIYSTRNKTDQLFYHEIRQLLNYCPNVKFYSWDTLSYGRVNASSLSQIVETPIENYKILLCGPENMMNSLQNQFLQQGVNKENIIFEQFNFMV